MDNTFFLFIGYYKWDFNDISTTELLTCAWFPFLITFSHWNLTCVVSHSHSLFFLLSNKWWEISAISFNFATVADLWCKSDCASETLRDGELANTSLPSGQNSKMFSALISKLPCQTRPWTRLSIDSPCDERVRSERFKGHLYPRRTPA